MDRAADVGSEHRVDAAMLLDAAHPGELRRDDGGAEVIFRAREIGHVGCGAGDRGLDALLEVVRGGHSPERVAVATLREVLDGNPHGSTDT